MKVLVTGAKGMLGRTLVRELGGLFEMMSSDLPEADITNESMIDAVIEHHSPDAVIHCAAMTAVDRCETERDAAFRLNAYGTANVASACRRHGVRLIAISTDYVLTAAQTGHTMNLPAPLAEILFMGRANLPAKRPCASFVQIM